MLEAHALGALDAEEARELEAYVAKHEDLHKELNEWLEMASLLAYAAPKVAEPSPAVRDKLFANIRAQARDSKIESTNNTSIKSVSTKPADNVIPFKARQREWNVIQVVTALAASVAIVLLSVLLWATWQSDKANQAEIAELKNRLNETQKRLDEQNKEIALFISPDSNVIPLKGLEAAPNAIARLTYDRKTGNTILIAEGLPAVPAGKAYQIWYITDIKKPTPGKTFKPDANGKAKLNDLIPNDSLQSSVFAVTIEDEKGATSPTGAMYLKS